MAESRQSVTEVMPSSSQIAHKCGPSLARSDRSRPSSRRDRPKMGTKHKIVSDVCASPALKSAQLSPCAARTEVRTSAIPAVQTPTEIAGLRRAQKLPKGCSRSRVSRQIRPALANVRLMLADVAQPWPTFHHSRSMLAEGYPNRGRPSALAQVDPNSTKSGQDWSNWGSGLANLAWRKPTNLVKFVPQIYGP